MYNNREKKIHRGTIMLKELTIYNFKSFNKEQTFSMEAAPKTEISEYCDEHILKFKNERLLKVSSFMGRTVEENQIYFRP